MACAKILFSNTFRAFSSFWHFRMKFFWIYKKALWISETSLLCHTHDFQIFINSSSQVDGSINSGGVMSSGVTGSDDCCLLLRSLALFSVEKSMGQWRRDTEVVGLYCTEYSPENIKILEVGPPPSDGGHPVDDPSFLHQLASCLFHYS